MVAAVTYPKPLDLIVGLDPGRCRQFRPSETLALLAAFQALTGADPLEPGVDLEAELAAALERRRGRREGGSEFRAAGSRFQGESSETPAG